MLNVLAITSELPWPLDTGGHLRSFYLLRALGARHRVRLVAPAPPGHESAVQALERNGIDVRPVPVGPRAAWREALRAAAAAVARQPYVLYRRHDRPAVRRAVRGEFSRSRPDVLYLDHLDSWLYRPLAPGCPCVIDLHNVYSRIAERTARETGSRPRRRYLLREAALLRRREQAAARAADVVFAVSPDERDYFAAAGARAASVVPNGVDCAAYEALPVGRADAPPLILYVGAMSWGPNAAAAEYLAREVLPAVRHQVPEARLRLVGKDPGQAIKALNALPGVQVTGGVPDVVPHLHEASVLAVPLESGGGTRLKILEAFAAGLPVISTPVGCEGLDVRDGENLLIADRPGFAAGVATLLRNPDLGCRLAAQARTLARDVYDWGKVGQLACAAVARAGARGHAATTSPPENRRVPLGPPA